MITHFQQADHAYRYPFLIKEHLRMDSVTTSSAFMWNLCHVRSADKAWLKVLFADLLWLKKYGL